MAQIYGNLPLADEKINFVPITVEDIGGGEYALKVTGTVGGGGATLGVVKHYNGVGEIANANVAFAATTKSIYIENRHATQILQVSFDGGATYADIDAGESLGIDAAHASIDIKASGAGTTYQILTTE
jgi:hypothetical protein